MRFFHLFWEVVEVGSDPQTNISRTRQKDAAGSAAYICHYIRRLWILRGNTSVILEETRKLIKQLLAEEQAKSDSESEPRSES